jgi:hypothetical protein
LTLRSSEAKEEPEDDGDLSANFGLLLDGRREALFKSVGKSNACECERKKVATRGIACGILSIRAGLYYLWRYLTAKPNAEGPRANAERLRPAAMPNDDVGDFRPLQLSTLNLQLPEQQDGMMLILGRGVVPLFLLDKCGPGTKRMVRFLAVSVNIYI